MGFGAGDSFFRPLPLFLRIANRGTVEENDPVFNEQLALAPHRYERHGHISTPHRFRGTMVNSSENETQERDEVEHARPRKRTWRACDKCSTQRARCDGVYPW
jgi:hypothetical protein